MTPADNLAQRLSDAPLSHRPQTLVEPCGDAECRFITDRVDPTGSSLREISVTRPAGGDLAERAGRVAAVRGLSENLRVLEIDPTRNEAIVRSDAPESRPDGVRYFEVVVGDERSTVKRYHAKPGEARESVPFPVTHETAARLAGALV